MVMPAVMMATWSSSEERSLAAADGELLGRFVDDRECYQRVARK